MTKESMIYVYFNKSGGGTYYNYWGGGRLFRAISFNETGRITHVGGQPLRNRQGVGKMVPVFLIGTQIKDYIRFMRLHKDFLKWYDFPGD